MPKSAVIRMLDIVYGNANEATGHSWERLNHAMRDALSLAIGSGLKFFKGDLTYIGKNYRSGYWRGESDEWIYCLAVTVGNMSAIQSFEQWKGREPFIATNVSPSHHHNGYLHMSGDRQKERLAVGFKFNWEGKQVTVTSFAPDSSYLTACSYKRVKGKNDRYGRDKLEKRFRITRSELLQGRAHDRERKRLIERAQNAPKEAFEKIRRAVKRYKTEAAIPLDKLREVVDKHAPLPPKSPRGKPILITQEQLD